MNKKINHESFLQNQISVIANSNPDILISFANLELNSQLRLDQRDEKTRGKSQRLKNDLKWSGVEKGVNVGMQWHLGETPTPRMKPDD